MKYLILTLLFIAGCGGPSSEEMVKQEREDITQAQLKLNKLYGKCFKRPMQFVFKVEKKGDFFKGSINDGAHICYYSRVCDIYHKNKCVTDKQCGAWERADEFMRKVNDRTYKPISCKELR